MKDGSLIINTFLMAVQSSSMSVSRSIYTMYGPEKDEHTQKAGVERSKGPSRFNLLFRNHPKTSIIHITSGGCSMKQAK